MPIKVSADYKKAFKDADIRGVYPHEIDEEVTYLIARAFVDEFSLKTVVVARDMRLSSEVLRASFCKGVNDAGADVIDIGLVHTPALYFASGSLNLPGVMITASHSPKNYNGLKLVLAGAIPLTEKHGLRAIRQRVEKVNFKEIEKPGRVHFKKILSAYQKFVLAGFRTKDLAGMKVAVDCGNGMSGVLLPLLEEKLPIKFSSLFADLDGNFPHHGSDPTLSKNQKAIVKLLKTEAHDLGIAFDGDADRIAFFDETGKYINSAIIGVLVAESILQKKPGEKFAYTNLTSRIFPECVKKAGGVPVPARVGHAFIKETMRQKDVEFGCEHSGHFYYKDYFYTDSVVFTLRYVLDRYAQAKRAGLTFSEMIAPYLVYEQTEDTIVMVDNQVKALAAVKQYLLAKNPKNIKKFDGYAVDYGEVWGSVKISVTEPALKMMFEAKKRKLAQVVQDDLVAYVKKIAHD